MTHPTGDHHHIEASPFTPEIAADPEHIPHTNQVSPPLLKPLSSSSRKTVKHQERNIGESPLMNPSPTTIALMIPQVILKMI